MTLNLIVRQPATAHSKNLSVKQRIANWLSKFTHTFEVDKTAIDLRDMVNNYPDEYIPVLDIADGIESVIGISSVTRRSVDPRNLRGVPKFTWITIDEAVVDPRFQRDVAPSHIRKIEHYFDSRMILVPCAIKMKRNDKDVYCIWDGGHTVQLLIRQGFTHIPVWYTDIDDLTEVEIKDAQNAMISLAGRSFLSINKTFKRPVTGYEEFMILYETHDTDTLKIYNILTANGCQPYRYKRFAGDVTHFEALWESYDLQNVSGVKGIYLARALAFHRKNWPKAAIEAEIMRPMAMLYQMCDLELGKMPSAKFDDDLAKYLYNRFGSAEAVQEGIKESYAKTFPNGRDNMPIQVVSGLLNIYATHINKEPVAIPPVRWDV